jgi:light-harvesting protein B-800-850 alpha chain
MNNAKIWLVVNPTVGIPLFLGAVAATSLFVHSQVLRNTTWLPTFLQGKPKKAASIEVPGATTPGVAAVVVLKTIETASAGGQEGLVVLPDGRTAQVIFTDPAARAPTALASSSLAVAK